MSTLQVIEEFEKLPVEEQKEVFVQLARKIASKDQAQTPSWLGKRLSFEEACNVVFRENRELLELLAK